MIVPDISSSSSSRFLKPVRIRLVVVCDGVRLFGVISTSFVLHCCLGSISMMIIRRLKCRHHFIYLDNL